MNAHLVAVDTTAEFGSLALLEGDRILGEVLLYSPEGFGHILFHHLERLLARYSLSLAEIDCFAVAGGPGAFTGVRVGLAAVKGLAEATSRPAVAVSNLKALAWFGRARLRATFLDARRGEIYGAVYDHGLELVQPEVVTRFPEWLRSLPETDFEFITTDFSPYRAAVAGTRFEPVPATLAPRALAGAVGLIAERLYREGRASDPAVLDANYVRRSDAELAWRE